MIRRLRNALPPIIAVTAALASIELLSRFATTSTSTPKSAKGGPVSQGKFFATDEGVNEYDPHARWRLKANLRANYGVSFNDFAYVEHLPDVPGKPMEVRSNALGFRGPEIDRRKPRETYRIVCQGDSITFGYPLTEGESYPDALREELAERYPQARVEVVNAGVVGYTSYKVREQFAHTVVDLRPDLVTVAVGFNDGAPFNGTDVELEPMQELAAALDRIPGVRAVRGLLDRVQSREAVPLLQGRKDGSADSERSYVPNVEPERFERHLAELLTLAESEGIDAMLLDLEFSRALYRTERRRVAETFEVPLVEFPPLFDAERWRLSDVVERRHGRGLSENERSTRREVERDHVAVLFRAVVPDGYPDEPLYLAYQAIDDFYKPVEQAPWDHAKHRLYDDGTHGDRRADDRIRSLELALPRDRLVKFFFVRGGDPARWEGPELGPNGGGYNAFPRWFYTSEEGLRALRPVQGGRAYYLTPVYTFGGHYLMSEPIHPNKAGYAFIARMLAERIEQLPSFQRHLEARRR